MQIFITDRIVHHTGQGVDLSFRVGDLEDSSLVARRILTDRHQLVASPAYLVSCSRPTHRRTCSIVACSPSPSGYPEYLDPKNSP